MIPVFLLFFLCSATKVQAAFFYLEPEAVSEKPGTQFSVKVKINTEGKAPKTAEAVILYDDSQLKLVRVDEPAESEKFFPIFLKKIQNNKVNVGGTISFGGTEGKSGAGLIATLVFEGVIESTNVVTFLCNPGRDTTDTNINVGRGPDGDVVECGKVNEGSYVITGQGSAPTATPRPTVSGGPTATRTPTPRFSLTPTRTPTPTTIVSASPTSTRTPTPTPSVVSGTPTPSPTPSTLPATGILRTTGTAVGIGMMFVVISLVVKALIL